MDKLLEMASERFGLSQVGLREIFESAPYRYKIYKIPKRREGEYRTVAQPAKEVKILQKWLVQSVIYDLPIHGSATAYISGRGIKYNAQMHLDSTFLLKMDFKKFFPSIKRDALTTHLEKYLPNRFSEEDCSLICNLVLWRPRGKTSLELCIGGPSSPFISNSIVYDFDMLILEYCLDKEITYTRYADDLVFSTNTPKILRDVETYVKEVCGELSYPALSVNDEKTIHTSKKHKRFITGITLASDNSLSLGRDRKRMIRAKIHRATQNRLSNDEMAHLRGLLAFANDIEPKFLESMRKRYGADDIRVIQRWQRIED